MKTRTGSIALLATTAAFVAVVGACSGGAGTPAPFGIGNEDPGTGYGPGEPAKPSGSQEKFDSGRPPADTGGTGFDSGSTFDSGTLPTDTGGGGASCAALPACCASKGISSDDCNTAITDCESGGDADACCSAILSEEGCT